MNEQKKQNVPILGTRQRGRRLLLYGVGVLRPNGPADLTDLRLESLSDLPALVVFATEHPDLPPPRLVLQALRGEDILVLSWLERNPLVELDEVADITYAWPIHGSAPRLLAIRKVQREEAMEAPLAEVSVSEIVVRKLSLSTSQGPGVCLDPAYLTRGVELFFGQYAQPKPADLADPLILAGIRPTASGRSARALGAAPLKGGGIRVRIAVPVDAGLPVWGPRDANRVDIFFVPNPGGPWEWLLVLE